MRRVQRPLRWRWERIPDRKVPAGHNPRPISLGRTLLRARCPQCPFPPSNASPVGLVTAQAAPGGPGLGGGVLGARPTRHGLRHNSRPRRAALVAAAAAEHPLCGLQRARAVEVVSCTRHGGGAFCPRGERPRFGGRVAVHNRMPKGQGPTRSGARDQDPHFLSQCVTFKKRRCRVYFGDTSNPKRLNT